MITILEYNSYNQSNFNLQSEVNYLKGCKCEIGDISESEYEMKQKAIISATNIIFDARSQYLI